jgi:N,N-dimethylformamidase
MDVVAYTDTLGAAPGETINVYVSCRSGDYDAQLVRLRHGDRNPAGPGFRMTRVSSAIEGSHHGFEQRITTGSHLDISNVTLPQGSVTIGMWIWPTLLGKGRQVLVSYEALACPRITLAIDASGRLTVEYGEFREALSEVLVTRIWYFVAATFDSQSRRVQVIANPRECWPGLDGQIRSATSSAVATSPSTRSVGVLRFACEATTTADPPALTSFYNGKIENPWIFERSLERDELACLWRGEAPAQLPGLFANWDFAQHSDGVEVLDTGPHSLHGRLVNLPARAMKGHAWTGDRYRHLDVPEQYGAIHFHEDDLEDAGWRMSFSLPLPRELPSGIYAIHLRSARGEDYVPFYVRPGPQQDRKRIALLVPSLTYLAYANEQLANRPGLLESLSKCGMASATAASYPATPADRYITQNRLLSLYDLHADGSGVCYASKLRPLLGMRPDYYMTLLGEAGAPHLLTADLHLVDWLEEKGFEYDVITDEDLDEHGQTLIGSYRAVLTGTHPEYYTASMRDALDSYLKAGGRLMYLGGNGFYWVTSLHRSRHAIEVRRGLGTRAWMADVAEEHHSTTGERGGLWKFRSRPPNTLVGTGFTAQGVGDPGRPYRRTEASYSREFADVFEGVHGDLIGDFPNLVLAYGAAGFEVDRADREQGTPLNTVVLASARVGGNTYQEVIEELPTATLPAMRDTMNDKLRADMTWLTYPNGGVVLAVSSILWCGSLSWNGYNNDVSQVTENVLRIFLRA